MRQFSPGACAELMHREQVDTLFGSPFIYGYLVDGVRDPSLLTSLKYCFNAGARIPSGVVERWRDRFGLAIRQTYGMSESGMIAVQRTESSASVFDGRLHRRASVAASKCRPRSSDGQA